MNNDVALDTVRYGFNDLYKLAIACIYAIECPSSGHVFVSYSKNLMATLGRIIGDIESYGRLRHDIADASVVILCTDASVLDDTKLSRLKVSLYAEQYKSKGYQFYKPTNLVKYKVDVKIFAGPAKAWYVVDLVNSRNEKILVGVFDRKIMCDDFLDKYYPNGVVTNFYCSNNELTVKWKQLYEVQSERTKLVKVE
jgi:hypothetical protein